VNNPEISSFRSISGLVMKTNIASVKSFERLGFVKTDNQYHYKFEKHL
jgi:L-amino acid N-acyltransferase YncA